MKISACMIVKDEEECLSRCLNSIRNVDEIVILDTGSIDKTAKVAKQYTDKYFPDEYAWNDNFAEARNFAAKKCTGDWILIIDADESLEAGGMEKIRKAIEETKKNSIEFITNSSNGQSSHHSVRVHRNIPEIFWKGAAHNYLVGTDPKRTDIKLTYGYSAAHKKDPDRTLRILKKAVKENPEAVRDFYYLGREYIYRKDWVNALPCFLQCIGRSTWALEIADSHLQAARALWNLQQGEIARDHCMKAIKFNANFKEAILFMAEMSGPKNKDRWLMFAETANNKDLLFVRTSTEQKAPYYDAIFSKSSDMSRYEEIYKKVAGLAKGKVLDVGCGTAEMQKYIKDYHGFDFSEEAVKIAKNPNVWPEDAYNINNYTCHAFNDPYETYLALEVLEHLDDFRVIKNIPKGKTIIFSVPSFSDPSHLRVYTEKILRMRYEGLINIEQIFRFNWDKKWVEGGKNTNSYILLVKGTIK